MLPPRAVAALVQHARRVAAAVILTILALVIVADAVIFQYFGPGPEAVIFGLFLFWPVAAGCGLAYALVSEGRTVVRVLVLLMGLAGPYIAMYIAPVTAPLSLQIREHQSCERTRLAERHVAFLQEYMSAPRSVIFVSDPFVVVEGGYSLELCDERVRPENRRAVGTYLATHLLGREVTATLPPDVLSRYNPNTRRGVTDPYAQGPSQGFGDAPAVVLLDGTSVSQEINSRWGYATHR